MELKSLSPQAFRRYRDVVHLLWKYGRADLVKRAGLSAELHRKGRRGPVSAGPDDLVRDLEARGPTFVKIGQMLSTQLTILPDGYAQALERLQDDVEPFDLAEVDRIITDELGASRRELFASFDERPLGSASLGQVHRATLHDGRQVVVKIQRPGIEQQIRDDFVALKQVANAVQRVITLNQDLGEILDYTQETILRELDYRREASNLRRLDRVLEEFERITVPLPVDSYSTKRVLTMQYIDGDKITEMGPLRKLTVQGSELAGEIFKAYLHQILVEGFYHADPHPGNVLLISDQRVALIDLGMVGYVGPRMQEQLLQLLMAIIDGQGERVADIAVKLGSTPPDAQLDFKHFRRRISTMVLENMEASVRRLGLGAIMLDLIRTCEDHGIRIPSELTSIGKALLNLDQLGQILDPEFQPRDVTREYSKNLLQKRLLAIAKPRDMIERLFDLKQLIEDLPTQTHQILENLTSNNLSIKVDAVDETRLIRGFQKIANRICVGLVIAAMVIGGSLLMQVDTDWTVFGEPILALIMLALAMVGAILLGIHVFFRDE